MSDDLSVLEERIHRLVQSVPGVIVKPPTRDERFDLLRRNVGKTRYLQVVRTDPETLRADPEGWAFTCMLGEYDEADRTDGIDARAGGSAELVMSVVREWLIDWVALDSLRRTD